GPRLPPEAPSVGTPAPAPAPALPDPDGGTLVAVAPGAPGTGRRPPRLAPAFAAVVAEYGARLPNAAAAGLLERVLGPVGHRSPTTVGTYTTAAGRARAQQEDAQQEDAQRVRPTPPPRAERQAVFDQPLPARPAAVLGDGAKWSWKLAARRVPQAVQIVDWYHAREHLWALAHLLYGEGTGAAWTWLETLAGALWVAHTTDDVAVLAQAAADA